MGQQISLFTDYHQKENRVTNYCGLILKLFYSESPASFAEVIQSLAGCDLVAEPRFEQQVKKSHSVPDLAITQSSFAVVFETKLSNWFYDDQIERHMQSIDKKDVNILFLLSNFENDDYAKEFEDRIAEADKKDIILAPVSYEDFLGALRSFARSPRLHQLVDEFGLYLSGKKDEKGESLLPSWKYRLDVVNCAKTMNEVEAGFYACPNTTGAYSHQRAKYFGPYGNKEVSAIYEIDAVVVLEEGSPVEIKWNNSPHNQEFILDRARKCKDKWPDWRVAESKNVPMQIFLLSNGAKTKFLKTSQGGLFGNKKYFHDIARNVQNAKELAERLNEKSWEDYR